MGPVAVAGGVGRAVLRHDDRRDQRRDGRRPRSPSRSDSDAGAGGAGASGAGVRGQQRLFSQRGVGRICRRTAARTLFRRRDLHSRAGRRGAGARAAQSVPRPRREVVRADGDDAHDREGGSPGGDSRLDRLSLPLPAGDDPAGHRRRALPYDAAPLRPAAVAGRLYRGGAESAAGRRNLRHGVPASERRRTPLCRARRGDLRTAEAVHRQRLARDADPAGGLPQPARNVGR